MRGIPQCSFGTICENNAKCSLVLIIGRIYLCGINLIIIWVDNLALQCTSDIYWDSWMVTGGRSV